MLDHLPSDGEPLAHSAVLFLLMLKGFLTVYMGLLSYVYRYLQYLHTHTHTHTRVGTYAYTQGSMQRKKGTGTTDLNCDGVPAILGASGFLFNATYLRPAVGDDTAPTNSKYDTTATGVMLTPSYTHTHTKELRHCLVN